VGAGYEKLTDPKAKMWIVGGTYDFGIAKLAANYAAGTTATTGREGLPGGRHRSLRRLPVQGGLRSVEG
jgi:predicted porin